MKYVIFSDIHFGNKSNSDHFNETCLNFLDFVQDYIDDNNIEVNGCFFLGDWFHQRNAINVKTLKSGIEGIYKLGNIGNGNSYMLLGNHDLYFKDRRDVSSIIVPEGDIGVEIIDEPIYLDEEKILLCPWLIGEENLTDLIKKHNPKYVFGHFEIPTFSLNKLVKFGGEYNPEDYKGPDMILSGHFHCRDQKNNITYIGNCFSNDFSDANDWHNKGFCILDTDTNELQFVEWKDAPKYCYALISKLDKIEFGSNMILKLTNDVGLEQLQLNQLKESLENMPQINECYIIPKKFDENMIQQNEEKEVENITDINLLITSLLDSLDMKNIENNKLIEIYNNL